MIYNSKEQVSRKDAKAQRKALFFAPLRALRGTSFSSNDGKTRIPRNISTRVDLCITSRAGAWEREQKAHWVILHPAGLVLTDDEHKTFLCLQASSPDVAACSAIRGNGVTKPGFRRKRLHPGWLRNFPCSLPDCWLLYTMMAVGWAELVSPSILFGTSYGVAAPSAIDASRPSAHPTTKAYCAVSLQSTFM